MSAVSERPLVPVLAVIGTGLIGGSFAASLKRVGQAGRVLGVGRNPDSMATAIRLGLVDEVVTIQQAGARADLILLATPIGAMQPILAELQPCLQPHTLISDAGSTKVDIAAMARQVLGDKYLQFIPGHPIAGSEMVGPQAADAMLYHGRKVILTPYTDTPTSLQHYLIRVWEACGARVQLMSAAEHDSSLAAVSHLPHFIAAAYMAQIARSEQSALRLNLAGTGFRDFTRIAAGSAEVWRDIFISNRQAVLTELASFTQSLEQLKLALENETDARPLEKILDQAAIARRLWDGRSKTE